MKYFVHVHVPQEILDKGETKERLKEVFQKAIEDAEIGKPTAVVTDYGIIANIVSLGE